MFAVAIQNKKLYIFKNKCKIKQMKWKHAIIFSWSVSYFKIKVYVYELKKKSFVKSWLFILQKYTLETKLKWIKRKRLKKYLAIFLDKKTMLGHNWQRTDNFSILVSISPRSNTYILYHTFLNKWNDISIAANLPEMSVYLCK